MQDSEKAREQCFQTQAMTIIPVSTEAENKTGPITGRPASSNAAMSQANDLYCLWSAQLRTAGHRHWTVNYVACFIFKRFSWSTSFF